MATWPAALAFIDHPERHLTLLRSDASPAIRVQVVKIHPHPLPLQQGETHRQHDGVPIRVIGPCLGGHGLAAVQAQVWRMAAQHAASIGSGLKCGETSPLDLDRQGNRIRQGT